MATEPISRGIGTNLVVPLLMAGAVVVVDQATKIAISRELSFRDQVTLVDGVLDLVYARNPGAAFSMLATAPAWFRGPFFVAVSVCAIVAIVIVVARSGAADRFLRIALGGILGGAVGNLVDRLLYGEVIDFIDVHWGVHHWPAFNVADSAISVSVVAIFLHSFFWGEELAKVADPGAEP